MLLDIYIGNSDQRLNLRAIGIQMVLKRNGIK